MHDLTLTALSAGLASGQFSSVELTRHFLQRIARLNPALNAFITVSEESALAEAQAADARRRDGDRSPLCGVPIAHKDIFCTRGTRTTCASKMLADFVAPYDATAVAKLRAAGVVMLGKTNMDEFAMGSSNENSFFGAARNPWDLARTPGGSSGGSASAVAARLVAAATGTDTGGSIRQPAALCGVTGIKPTYGRVSRHGMIAFASSLDQGGVLAHSAEDAALLLQAMAGFDPHDSTSVDRPVPDYRAGLSADLGGVRIGVPREFFDAGLDPAVGRQVQAALDVYASLGATLVDVTLPNAGMSVPAYYVVAPAEASSNLSRYDGVRFGYRCDSPRDLDDLYTRTRAEGFGAEVRRRILTGTYVLSAGFYDAYYRKAQQVRALIAADFARAFEQVDVLAGPTSPTVAFGLGEKCDDPVQMYLTDIYTTGASLAGLPGMSVPCGFVADLPVGLQLIAPHFAEQRLFDVGHALQQATDWHNRTPSTDELS